MRRASGRYGAPALAWSRLPLLAVDRVLALPAPDRSVLRAMKLPGESRREAILDRVDAELLAFGVRGSISLAPIGPVVVRVSEIPEGLRERLADAARPRRVRLKISDSTNRYRSPIGFGRVQGQPVADADIRAVVLQTCSTGQHRPPRRIRRLALLRIDRGDPPREVAAWLVHELTTRGRSPFPFDMLLGDD